MVKYFWVVRCILIIMWAVVAVKSAKHHEKAPLKPPELAPASGGDCSTIIYSMVDCLSFLTAGSNVTKPEESCCSAFKLVLDTNSECICESLKSSANLGIDLNVTKALTLPSACGISAPSLTSCNVSLPPGAAPDAAPVNPPPPKNAPPPNSQTPPAAPAMPPTTNSPPPTITGGAPIPQVSAPVPGPSPAKSSSFSISISLSVLFGVVVANSFFFILV